MAFHFLAGGGRTLLGGMETRAAHPNDVGPLAVGGRSCVSRFAASLRVPF